MRFTPSPSSRRLPTRPTRPRGRVDRLRGRFRPPRILVVPGVSDRRLRKSAEAGTHAGGTAVRAVALVPERPGGGLGADRPRDVPASYILLTAGAKEVLHAWRVQRGRPSRSSRERDVDDEGGVSAVPAVSLEWELRVSAHRDARRAREGRPRDVEERMRLRGGVRSRVRSEVHGRRGFVPSRHQERPRNARARLIVASSVGDVTVLSLDGATTRRGRRAGEGTGEWCVAARLAAAIDPRSPSPSQKLLVRNKVSDKVSDCNSSRTRTR